MSEKLKASGKYHDIEFELDGRWRFRVPDLDKEFDSYMAMTEAIDRNAKFVVAAKRRKLNIPAVTEGGDKLLVTGVHSGHGHAITNPKRERYDDDFYPDTPLVAESLKERRRLASDAERVEVLLDGFNLRYKNYRSFDSSQHGAEVERLKKIAAKAEAAARTPLAEALKKVKPRKETEF